MKQIKEWVRRLSICKKLVFYSYLIMAPILLLISVLLFFYNYEKMIRNEEANCLQSVQGLADSFEALQGSAAELGTYICINFEINQILTTRSPESLNQDAQLWQHNAPMQIIQDMMAINGELKTIAIYPENGVTPYLQCLDRSSYLSTLEEVREQDVYKTAVREKSAVWQRVGKFKSDTFFSNQSEKIVMYREIYDQAQQKQLGYLVIGSSADKFDEVCDNALRSEREEVVVLSPNGEVLVQCGGLDDKEIIRIIEKSEKTQHKALCAVSEQNYRIYRCFDENNGIIVYKFVTKENYLTLISSAVYAPFVLLIGLLIGLYPLMVIVSNIVSKPLQNLQAAMNHFKQGDFNQKVEVVTMDEVGEASACFNEMVDDMKELIDKNYVLALKEKESELDALQAQINPHFLYNTLDSLYWRTVDAGEEEIGEDILALSELFRFVLGRGNGIVTVRHEAELIERYLHIQKMRFGKRLDYNIRIEEEILDEEIPKLILQPFVENAIVHGFENGGDHFSLSVTGKKAGDKMQFCIHDTGVGMTKEQVEMLLKGEDAGNYKGHRIGRYAVKNVRERLELSYHEECLLQIKSEVGVGTKVEICVPYRIR